MSKPTKNLHLSALRGAVKGLRKPGRKLSVEERREAARRAKVAEGSDAYQHLEKRLKLRLPSPEEQRRMRKKYALQYSTVMQSAETRRHLFGSDKVLKPEHRQSLLEHADSISRSSSSAMIPEKLRKLQETDKQLKGRHTLALVRGTWYTVWGIRGRSEDGYNKPYFIGLGSGFDIQRFLVWAPNDSDASDIAENAWPKQFFDEILTAKALDKKIADGEEDEDHWAFIESLGKMGKRTEDVRIFEQAEDVAYHAKIIAAHENLYRLPDGRLVEAA